LYYRLKITDRSGGVTYSRIAALYRDERNESGFSILPNPVQSKAFIAIQSINDKSEKAEISILNQSGFLIRQFNVLLNSNNATVPLENMEQYPPGVYVVKVSHGGQHFIQRMVLTR